MATLFLIFLSYYVFPPPQMVLFLSVWQYVVTHQKRKKDDLMAAVTLPVGIKSIIK